MARYDALTPASHAHLLDSERDEDGALEDLVAAARAVARMAAAGLTPDLRPLIAAEKALAAAQAG